jgi:NAD(P)H-dependent FMN reductase
VVTVGAQGEVVSTLVQILAVSGSLQDRSANSALIRAAQRMVPPGMELVVHPTLGTVPLLNPELDGDAAPAAVGALRAAFGSADGVLIASPEYGHSMPGLLKNALDWLVGSGELANMPVALVSASTTGGGGIRAQIALIQTLLAQAADVVVTLTVPGVKNKLDAQGEIADPAVLRRLRETLVALGEAAEERHPRYPPSR